MTEDPYAEWDAAYVLGALSPVERREFERHMAGCASCREAVTELAGMPAVLSELSAQQAVALAAPSVEDPDDGGSTDAVVVPIARLAASAQRERRRRRVWQVAAAAALVVAGGAGATALSSLGGDDVPPADATTVSLQPIGGSNVTADVALSTSPWGTSMEWSCDYPSYGGGTSGPGGDVVYELVLIGDDGARTVVGTWTGNGDAHPSGLLASSAIPIADISRVELTAGDDLVLAAADLQDA